MFTFTRCTNLHRVSLLAWCALSISLAIVLPNSVSAQERCDAWVGKVVSAEGVVQARLVTQTNWKPTKVDETFCPGDKLRVETWRAAIVMANETIIRLDQGTTITFTEIENKESSWLELLEGIVHFISRVPQNLTITTPFVNATVEGTEFVIRVDNNETNVWVLEGTVGVENTLGKLLLDGGDAAVTKAGEAPKRQIDMKPRDAVQWALYYPPLLDVSVGAVSGANQDILRSALAQYQTGDIRGALDQLNTIPLEQRDPQFLGIRAGLLLSVGQIDKATMDIQEALRENPSNGTSLALQSIVALVNNEKEDALQLANQSVTSSPQSSVGHVALSYAQQAHFDIEPALVSAQEATQRSPEDALAWARVAELQLSLGNLVEAREAAQQAVNLNPRLARTQTILGFALLNEAKIADARATFEHAITLDQAAPLPRLGLGLTKIQKSHLAEGRRDIEIAASLDPSNAIIRSYLGKAYFEEKWDPRSTGELEFSDLHNNTEQNRRAAAQLQMAKELDPKDPTPYFYDAIRKQSVNQPIKALSDLQKSIELNDNRAVYRSSLLLDEDFGARSASLGRVYRDLGFQQRARVEGWNSLAPSPTNYSAHRLLADSYARVPRLEVARVSEILQSQLFQPVNINNLQPQLSETSLQILEGTGPTSGGFNEFNPIFMRDRVAFLGNLTVANRDTVADNLIFSGMLADPVSLSIGQFHYETDGFRRNNDNKIDLYNVFLQGKVTQKVNLQGEFRYRKAKLGDLVRNFDPADFLSNFNQNETQKTARLGGRISPGPNTDLVVSLIYSHLDSTSDTGQLTNFNVKSRQDAYQGESQIIFRNQLFNTILGGGKLRISGKFRTELGPITLPFPPFMTTIVSDPPSNIYNDNAYIYFNSTLSDNFILTGGLAYSDLKIEALGIDVKRVLPKVGVQLNITDRARLRLAYFQTVKSNGVIEQTIEPTQIAGFNQMFIDSNGTRSTKYGIALDTILTKALYVGVEASNREYGFLSIVPTMGTREFHFRTNVYRAYAYWAPQPSWSVNSEIELEKVYRPANIATGTFGDKRFTQLNTLSIPIGLRFYHSSGLFAGIRGTFLWQHLELPSDANFKKDSEKNFLLDVVAGYRFPKRQGLLTLEVKNLTDKNFLFQDPNVLRPEVGNEGYIPDLTALVKITLVFN